MSNNERDMQIAEALTQREIPQHEPSFFEDLNDKLTSSAPTATATVKPRRYVRYLWAGPAVAAAVATVLVVSNLNGDPKGDSIAEPKGATSTTVHRVEVTQPKFTLASQVLGSVNQQLASVKSIAGTVHYESFAGTFGNVSNEAIKTTTSFRLTDSGNIWAKETSSDGSVNESSYLSSSGEHRQKSPYGFVVTTNSQPPVPTLGLYRLTFLTSLVRAMANANDLTLKEDTFNERQVWQLETNTSADLYGITPDHYVISVDKESLFPVRVVGTRLGKSFDEVSLGDLKLNETYSDSEFHLAVPKGAKVQTLNQGYRIVERSQVKSTVGYEPFMPAYVPGGFALAQIAVNKDAGVGGPEGSNANNRNVVVLTYRRGLESFRITTRASANDGAEWNDPLSYEGEPPSKKEKVKLAGGSFADLTADVVATSTSPPHLWTIGARWLLTVDGDLGRDDLVKIAESLSSPSVG